MKALRIALFACTYKEVDGVANTVRQFEAYAKRHSLPMLLLHGGFENEDVIDGSVRRIEFRRKFPKFPLDKQHDFDLLFWRYFERSKALVQEFKPDIVHITGPSDTGLIGALVAHRLSIPLVASWHTNLHEYAERRALPLMSFLPDRLRKSWGEKICGLSFDVLARFHKIPQMLFAPNQELVEMMRNSTGKECHLMWRGVDADLFSPVRRTRHMDSEFVLGFVGRLTAEKSVEMLVRIERVLLDTVGPVFRFNIVGQGSSEPFLRENLKRADFAGVLKGERLAEAYANMDAFVFPSRTDTFGNVVLEALASGVPAIVTDAGGPKFIVHHGETGFIARDEFEFAAHIAGLIADRERHRAMCEAARRYAVAQSWDAVFDSVYEKYDLMSRASSAKAGNLLKGTQQPTAAGISA